MIKMNCWLKAVCVSWHLRLCWFHHIPKFVEYVIITNRNDGQNKQKTSFKLYENDPLTFLCSMCWIKLNDLADQIFGDRTVNFSPNYEKMSHFHVCKVSQQTMLRLLMSGNSWKLGNICGIWKWQTHIPFSVTGTKYSEYICSKVYSGSVDFMNLYNHVLDIPVWITLPCVGCWKKHTCQSYRPTSCTLAP